MKVETDQEKYPTLCETNAVTLTRLGGSALGFSPEVAPRLFGLSFIVSLSVIFEVECSDRLQSFLPQYTKANYQETQLTRLKIPTEQCFICY